MMHLFTFGTTEMFNKLSKITDDEIHLPGHLIWERGLVRSLEECHLCKADEVLDFTYEKYLIKAELCLFDESNIEDEKKT